MKFLVNAVALSLGTMAFPEENGYFAFAYGPNGQGTIARSYSPEIPAESTYLFIDADSAEASKATAAAKSMQVSAMAILLYSGVHQPRWSSAGAQLGLGDQIIFRIPAGAPGTPIAIRISNLTNESIDARESGDGIGSIDMRSSFMLGNVQVDRVFRSDHEAGSCFVVDSGRCASIEMSVLSEVPYQLSGIMHAFSYGYGENGSGEIGFTFTARPGISVVPRFSYGNSAYYETKSGILYDQASAGRVSASIVLEDFGGSLEDVDTACSLTDAAGHHWESWSQRLDSASRLDHRLDFPLTPGGYWLRIKPRHWLAKKVHVTPLNAHLVEATLINGDVDNDNEIGVSDCAILASAFGTGPEDENWFADADLDGDLAVDIADYSILSLNYGAAGE